MQENTQKLKEKNAYALANVSFFLYLCTRIWGYLVLTAGRTGM
jgi:hypothetical protein